MISFIELEKEHRRKKEIIDRAVRRKANENQTAIHSQFIDYTEHLLKVTANPMWKYKCIEVAAFGSHKSFQFVERAAHGMIYAVFKSEAEQRPHLAGPAFSAQIN